MEKNHHNNSKCDLATTKEVISIPIGEGKPNIHGSVRKFVCG